MIIHFLKSYCVVLFNRLKPLIAVAFLFLDVGVEFSCFNWLIALRTFGHVFDAEVEMELELVPIDFFATVKIRPRAHTNFRKSRFHSKIL